MRYFSFEECLHAHNIPYPNKPIVHHRFTRWGPNSRYYAICIEEGIHFGDWGSDIKYTWFPPKEDYAARERCMSKNAINSRKKFATEITEKHKQTAVTANEIWNQCDKEQYHVARHPYLVRKLVKPYGIGLRNNRLIIPVADIAGKIWSIQYIDVNGNKCFLKDGRKKACCYVIGSIKDTHTIYVCEGFATAATVYELTHIPTVVAFDAYNLLPLIGSVRKTFPNINIIIAGDNDNEKK